MPNNVEVVLIKAEATYNNDPVLTVASDAFIVFDWDPQPMIYDEVRRKIDRPFPGRRPKIKTRARQGHNFKLELSGGGAAATAAKWGSVVLRACLFDAPTIAADVTYPLGTAGDGSSVAIAGYKGNDSGGSVRHRAGGVRGSAKFVFVEGDLPYIECTMLGLLDPAKLPDGVAPGVPTLPTYPAPVEVNTINTTFTLGGYALLLRSFELDLGMKTKYRSLVGQRAIIFGEEDDGDRRSAGGKIVCEVPDPAVKTYFADPAARTNLALSLVHGTVAGNIIDLSSAVLQIDEPTYSVEDNRLMMSFGYDLVPSAAGNELVLKTR
ncbi:MAG TPA: hypothetical protein PK808_04815 [Polymorphobacter sp.]|nr:hypothetical protein [Polymorphobacter sp.]